VKKGICYGCIDEGDTFEAKLAAARQAGYDGVELSFDSQATAPLRMGMDRGEVERLRATVESHGLEVRSLMSGATLRDTPILHSDPAIRRQAVANLAAALQTAAWIGAGTILVHPGQLRPDTRYDEAWGWTVQVLRDLIPACEQTGVGLGLENVWNKFLLAPTEMRQLLDEVGHPLVGCYLDTAKHVAVRLRRAVGGDRRLPHPQGPRQRLQARSAAVAVSANCWPVTATIPQ